MTALAIFLLLTVKHALCDLFLQSYLRLNKGLYTGGWPHYAQHGVATLAVLLLFADIQLAVALAVADFLAHWHIDFAKHRIIQAYERHTGVAMERWNRSLYWFIQAADQILHFVTYYILAVIVLGAS